LDILVNLDESLEEKFQRVMKIGQKQEQGWQSLVQINDYTKSYHYTKMNSTQNNQCWKAHDILQYKSLFIFE